MNLWAGWGQMKMSHLIADTDDELHAMVDKIGVDRRWFQHAGEPGRHYDIAKSKRQLAIDAGAVAITMRQCASMCARRRVTGDLGRPEDAIEWKRRQIAARNTESSNASDSDNRS